MIPTFGTVRSFLTHIVSSIDQRSWTALFISAPQAWNQLPADIGHAATYSTFKYTVSQIKRGHFSFRHNFYSCQGILKIFEARNFAHLSASTDVQQLSTTP